MKNNLQLLKNIFFLYSFFFVLVANAQAPEKMSYQAVIRNASNALVTNQSIGMRITILKTTATGTVVYQETQTTTTNANGLASIEIGGGTVISGTFANIDWSADKYFVKTETDPTGGASYSITATSQLLSTSYALYAKKAGNSTITELVANKVGGTGETLPLAGSTTPTTIVFNNVVTATSIGNYNPLTGVYTVGANGAGTYLIQVKLLTLDNATPSSTVSPYITLIKNNATYGSTGSDVYYGDYPMIQSVLPTGIRGQGSLTKVVPFAAGDNFKIVAVSANSATASPAIATVAGSYISIVKLN